MLQRFHFPLSFLVGCVLVISACEGISSSQESTPTAQESSGDEVSREEGSGGGASTTFQSQLCQSFRGHRDTGNMELKARLHGCPVWMESLEKLNEEKYDGTLDTRRTKQLSEKFEAMAQNEVKLALVAEKSGYLKRPEVQRALLRVIGNMYMRDTGLAPKIGTREKVAYFKEHRDEFGQPEHRFGRHILFSVEEGQSSEETRKKAQEFYAKHISQGMASGEFARLAAQHSEDAETSYQGGLLDATAEEGGDRAIAKPLAHTLFAMERTGQVSQPIRTERGWHIVYLARVVPGREVKYEDVENLVHMKLKKEKYNDFLDKHLARSGF